MLPPPGAHLQGSDGTDYPPAVAISAAVGAATDVIVDRSSRPSPSQPDLASAKRLMRQQLILQRRHSNGRVSEVLRQTDGRYTARDAVRRGFAGWHGFTANISSVHDAKAIAVMHSHADGCDAGCGAWIQIAHDDAING
jgi:hypothetical protein